MDEASTHISKKPRLEDDEYDTFDAMKVAGFSLSAIEEMKTRVNEERTNEALDKQLRHFQVLDEVQASDLEEDEDSDGGMENDEGREDNEDGDELSSEMDLDEDEIENLLDEKLPEDLKQKKKKKYQEMQKTVLEEKGQNHFEVLPEGWVQVTHNSGMPLFLHKQSRVCSTTRPYFLGTGSVRKHAIPLSAVPCLKYRRALEEETTERERLSESTTNGEIEKQTETTCPFRNNVTEPLTELASNGVEDSKTLTASTPLESNNLNGNDIAISGEESTSNQLLKTLTAENGNNANAQGVKPLVPSAKILTVHENTEKESLTPIQLNDYCKNLFKFRQIRVLRFRSWHERRQFTKNRKNIKNLQRPTLPDGTKLIKFPILATAGETNNNPRARKEWIMNPNGKSFICILHEYVQHALKKQPTYEFKELENAATPYSATVSINELKYGTGYGTSKKQAKSEAARETLEILIPGMKDKITGGKPDKNATKSNNKDLSVFDDIKIEDPRVAEFCNKTTEPSPHTILLTCLQRNFGLGDVQISYEINRTKNKKNEFTMTVGKHTAKVYCKNKREGKQLASQAILQTLHPHIKTWGSLLRLYGNNSIKTFKEKKLEEQEITVLQSKAAINQPNYAILEKLRADMIKLAEKNKAIKESIGTFVPPHDVDLPTASGSNLKNVEL